MRNKVKLFIEGVQADLDDGSFLLLNYTAEDLENPTVVRNSFSRQIALKGTPRNDEIFGHIYRNDRVTVYGSPYTGPNFDPTRKTSFTIYNEMNEILESGYLKLDEVVTTRRRREYRVTLYGGLGSFLYGLSYDTDGNKRSLADLTFPETLDFTIDRDAVAAAWARLGGDTSKPAKWDIINFAPCYNGKPTKPFDANKCLVDVATVGLPATDGDYSAAEGKAIVTLDAEVTEQEAKDYRSYLQRPVIKVSAIINAICQSANNGGWTVQLDPAFFVGSNPYWNDTWLTLPMLNELNIDTSGTTGDDNFNGGTFTIPGGGNLSRYYNVWMDFAMVGSGGAEDYVLYCEDDWAAGMQGDDTPGFYQNYIEWEVVAYDSNDAVISHFFWRASTQQTPAGEVQMDEIFDYISVGYTFYKDGSVWKPNISVQGYGIAKVSVTQRIKGLAWGHLRAGVDPNLMWPTSSYDYQDGVYFDCYAELQGSYIKYQVVNSSTVRTGASITAATLLASDHTPADYLLSYCKTFGLQIVCHKDEKTVEILRRDTLYNGGTRDINSRIDRGREISKVPFAFDSRWYLFGAPTAGDFAEYYANKYGGEFGQYRVNTGYDFNADERKMTDGIIFRGGCEVLETSKHFCDVVVAGVPVPAVFLAGGKLTLYKGNETKDFPLPFYASITRTWENPTNPMHDDFPKLQVHGADNAHQDGRDTLLFFDGMKTPASAHVTLSDDTRQMLTLNGNTPCWMPGYCDYDPTWLLSSLPHFSRYVAAGSAITAQLDWGTPVEVQIPGVTIAAGSGIFGRYWSKYIADRYDDDSAVVTAYVDFRGIKVDENLLRGFYWFDGALWALNRIIDHSLTTNGPTKCEFVKVQDANNYTTL